MATLVLGERDVRELLDYPAAIERMDQALRTMAAGDALEPPRVVVELPGGHASLGLMPGYLGGPPTAGAKVLAVVPANRESGRPSHQGVVVVFDPTTGETKGLIDASSLTEIRTAATSAVATRVLARREATVLGVVGTGAQARAHALAIPHVRQIERIRLWGPTAARRQALAGELARTTSAEVMVCDDAATVVRGADVVCTTTASREPWLRAEWLAPGTHVNAVGASVPGYRELEASVVARARVFVDRLSSAWAASDDLRVPVAEGAVGREVVVGGVGDVLRGEVPGRTDDDQVTVFKSVGLAVEDLAAARFLLERAAREGRGSLFELTLDPRR